MTVFSSSGSKSNGGQYRLSQFHDFKSLPSACIKLIEQSDGSTFDQSLPWLHAFSTHILQHGDRLVLHVVELVGDGRPVAFLPVVERRKHRFMPCTTVDSLSNYYTAHYGPVVTNDVCLDSLVSMLSEALTAPENGWCLIDLNPLDKQACFFDQFAHAMRRCGAYVVPYFRFGNWYSDVSGISFEGYYQQLPSALKNTYQRKSKRLLKEAMQVRVVEDLQEVDEAMAHYELVYQRSWKDEEPHREFIRDVARRFAEQGWLRLGLLYVNGQPVASQLWFVYKQTASIFKLAYDSRYHEFSVGTVLTMKMMEHVIDQDNVNRIDFLCGDDEYKKNWMGRRRERWGMRFYNARSARGFLGGRIALTTRFFKSFFV